MYYSLKERALFHATYTGFCSGITRYLLPELLHTQTLAVTCGITRALLPEPQKTMEASLFDNK
jgi:hypothetical protein